MIPVPGAEDGDCYLSTAELADILGCTRGYVSVLRGRNDAPSSFRFGRTLLTRRSEAARYLEAKEHGGEVAGE